MITVSTTFRRRYRNEECRERRRWYAVFARHVRGAQVVRRAFEVVARAVEEQDEREQEQRPGDQHWQDHVGELAPRARAPPSPPPPRRANQKLFATSPWIARNATMVYGTVFAKLRWKPPMFACVWKY